MDDQHYSYSQINMYLRCGEQYFRRYELKEKIPPSIPLHKGKSAAAGAELNFKQKIETKEDLYRNIIIDYSVNVLEESIKADDIFLKPNERTTGKKKIIGQMVDDVCVLSGIYSDYTAPLIQPTMVEQKISIPIPNSYPIIGYMDCVDSHNNIRDMKTTTRTKNQREADTSLQLTVYAMGYEILTGHKPNNVCLDVLVQKKEPAYVPLVSQRTEKDYTVAMNIIYSCIDGIEKGVFLPAQPGSWQCSSDWCGYYDTCKFV